MKYDFTSIMNRHGKDAIAVDSVGQMNGFAPEAPKPGFDVIPMWVADMNFPTVPTIQQAIIERAQHPAFGYFSATDEYYDSIIRWHQTRNGVTGLTKECIGYENGVLGGVISALTSFAAPGDAVLLHSPTYIGFTASVENNGYKIVHSPLVKDENGVWRMDFEDMDAKIKANHIHVAIFCSPHNPCGRVWERWELEKAMEVYRANDCLVISDEIWSDIILNGHKHIPTQSVSEDARSRTVALYAPSKTFNLAGLVGSYHIIYNPYLRDRVRAKSSKPHYNDMNVLSMHALIGAYKPEGYEWVEELRESLCELIVGGKEGLQPVEKTVIDRCVHQIYQTYFEHPVPENMPVLQDLYEALLRQDEKEAHHVATALEIYVTGSLNLFNHRTNVDINNRLVCYDIKELGKQLKKIGMLVVQDQVWGRVTANRNAGKATRYYMDEFHLLLKEEQTAAYSVEIWKRFRKWGGIPTGITQNVKDLLSSREVTNIFENSDFIYMLNQAAGDRQILADQLNISPHQLSYVTHSGEGEGLLFYGNVILPFVDRFPTDLELYRIMTTKLTEVKEAKEA